MTRMLPDSVPTGTTASETEVFRLIRDADRSADCICLHSLGIARHRRKEYAEADFVFIAPAGVYCLEVKGGEVRRRNGVWQIGWPGKSYTSHEGPFKQAEGARWALLDYLQAWLGERFRREVLLGWGVVFPDVCFSERGPEWDGAVVFDQRDKAVSFVDYIARLERYFSERLEETGKPQPNRLSRMRVEEIAKSLRGDFDFVPSVRGLLVDSDRELVGLSTDQYRILDFALNDGNPRILCDGGAGTGKTLVAVEAARRLERSGKSVLLLCFNENLGHFLKLDVSDSDARILVRTLYSFLGEVIRRGGYGETLAGSRASVTSERLFGEVYPQLFESACDALLEEGQLPQYDVIIIDEAQDLLHAPVMNCLDLVLAGGFAGGRWLVFHDSGLQGGLYGRIDEKVLARLRSLGAATFLLNENFRNPKTVVAEMCAVTGAPKPICRRELISPVDYRVVTDERDQAKKLRALLVELLREGVPPGRITILSAVNLEAACVCRHPPDVGKSFQPVGREPAAHSEDAFTIGTISGFKGLENDIIVLTDIASAPNSGWLRSVLYVGMTRARTKLFAMVPQEFLNARVPG